MVLFIILDIKGIFRYNLKAVKRKNTQVAEGAGLES
jgi:hypothetical protein